MYFKPYKNESLPNVMINKAFFFHQSMENLTSIAIDSGRFHNCSFAIFTPFYHTVILLSHIVTNIPINISPSFQIKL